jgi:cellobiose-specific phosphotransferase system component IIA
MALEIKPAPVLSGKAAKDFYKSLKHAKESKSEEEVQEIAREVRAFMAKQNKLR